MSDRVNAHGLNSYITIFILMAALVIGAPAFADVASYESDFTNFGGSDASSISTISSSTGNMPGSNWTVTTSSGVGAGWLTQGTIDGTPTTVKFFHNSATTNAKARFSTWLPPLWRAIGLQDTTLIVEYRMKYGVGYNATIGAIQIVYPTRYANFDSVIRVRQTAPDANTLVMPRREGGDAVGVNELDLGRDINGEWHDWRVEVRYGEYANYDTKLRYWSYWNVYLDGEKLFFSGPNGSPTFQGQTYSFRRSNDNSSSLWSQAFIALGEMGNSKAWEFECDYVNFSAEITDPPLPEIYRWSFDTTGDAEGWNRKNPIAGQPDEPSPDLSQADTWNGAFVNLMGRDPFGWPWDGTQPTSGGALRLANAGDWGLWLGAGDVKQTYALNNDVMAIEFNALISRTSKLKTDAWLDFYIREPGVPFAAARLRTKAFVSEGRVDLTPWSWSRNRFTVEDFKKMELMAGSKWWENPGTYPLENLNTLFAVNFVSNMGSTSSYPLFIDDIRLYGRPCGEVQPQQVVLLSPARGSLPSIPYTFRHTGSGQISYTVAETDAAGNPYDYAWLTLDKTGGGPVDDGQSDTVTVTVTNTVMEPGLYTAYLTFVDTCDPVATHTRRIDMYLPGPFADADEDGDVDMNDFAAFQRCWTQADDPESTFDASKCGRFDQDGDSDVDEDDLSAFAACATGAEVVWTSTPGCP
ncbi:MAG TPA: hypothetical protein PL151_03385 [Phycisphaerae bacterium]|nr:hypothetical protein [Phycisphaerae bacterium]HQE26780.1 hypothetical protein [Phycisphaerae bacterium]